MKSVQVSFSSTESVKDFVNAVSHYPFDVDMHSGRYIVDAKSLLGIFSLDLAKPITCEIYSDNCAELLKDIAKFIVK
ncbi:MAG: HPr family phosphocarrier protein [Clostridia bacterium]|nr:HPr family phosphocarrier protein [Clostridia bacterium]